MFGQTKSSEEPKRVVQDKKGIIVEQVVVVVPFFV